MLYHSLFSAISAINTYGGHIKQFFEGQIQHLFVTFMGRNMLRYSGSKYLRLL